MESSKDMLYLSFLKRMVEQYGEADCSYTKETLKEVKVYFNDGYIINVDNKKIIIWKKNLQSVESQGEN